jgi:hypothetical protein
MLTRHCISIILFLFGVMSTLATMLEYTCFTEDLLAKLTAIRSGAEDLIGMTKEQYMARLRWLKIILRFSATNIYNKRNFDRVATSLEMLRLDDSNGSIREQPFCILLTGAPGCGKSNFAIKLASACLRSRYGSVRESDIVVLNETDEYQSEYRSSHKVVIFDDMGATTVDRETNNPWRKVIDFVNNIRKTALNPNVEMKGIVHIRPKLVILTTNLNEPFQTTAYQTCYPAILRRLNRMIHLHDGYIMANLISRTPTDRPLSRSYGCDYDFAHCDPMSREDIIDLCVTDFNVHLDAQEEFVRQTNSVFDTQKKFNFREYLYNLIPKTIPLSIDLEKKLPWYTRLGRKFCRIDKNALVAQMGIETPTTKEEILLDLVDWELFESLQLELSQYRDSPFIVYHNALVVERGFPIVYSRQLNFYSRANDYPRSFTTSYDELKLILDEQVLKTTLEEVSEVTSDDENIRIVFSHVFANDKSAMQVKDLGGFVKNANKKLAELKLGKVVKQDSMAPVQFALAKIALVQELDVLGVEHDLFGVTPDVVINIDDVLVIIETKNTTSSPGKKQIEKYMDLAREQSIPCLGVVFTQRSFKIYARNLEHVNIVEKVKHLISLTLRELARDPSFYHTSHFTKSIGRCGAAGPLSDIIDSDSG